MAENRWTSRATIASMAYVSAMPLRSASALTFLYALGYPVGALAVSALSPMAVLIFRFGLAAAILGSWALLARVSWPTGVALIHVLVSGLLAQGLVLGALACWLNARPSGQQSQHDPTGDGGRQHAVDAVHQPAVAG
jgi:hypothetical protein